MGHERTHALQQIREGRQVPDQLPDPSVEFHRPCDPNLEAEVTQGTAQVALDGNVLRQQLAGVSS